MRVILGGTVEYHVCRIIFASEGYRLAYIFALPI
jgi:hypothetical protein